MIFALYITGQADQILSIAIKNPGLNESRNPNEFHIITGNEDQIRSIIETVAPSKAARIIKETKKTGKFKGGVPVDPTKPVTHCQESYGVVLVTL